MPTSAVDSLPDSPPVHFRTDEGREEDSSALAIGFIDSCGLAVMQGRGVIAFARPKSQGRRRDFFLSLAMRLKEEVRIVSIKEGIRKINSLSIK